jgi:hypothetical protein
MVYVSEFESLLYLILSSARLVMNLHGIVSFDRVVLCLHMWDPLFLVSYPDPQEGR